MYSFGNYLREAIRILLARMNIPLVPPGESGENASGKQTIFAVYLTREESLSHGVVRFFVLGETVWDAYGCQVPDPDSYPEYVAAFEVAYAVSGLTLLVPDEKDPSPGFLIYRTYTFREIGEFFRDIVGIVAAKTEGNIPG